MVSPASFLPAAYVCCGLLPLALVGPIRSAGSKPGRTGLLVSIVGLSVWSISIGLLFVASASLSYLLLATLTGLGSQLTAIGYFLMAAEYTGALESTRRLLGALAAVVVFVQLLSITDPVHHLVWAGSSSPPLTEFTLGPVAIVVVVLTFVLGVVAWCLLVFDAATASGVRRKQSLALIVTGAPTIGFFLVDSFVLTDADFVLLPFGFVGSSFALAWALFRADFLEVVPVGRKRIVEEMDDAAIVLDGRDRVVECNPAARRLVGVGPDYAGMPVTEFFGSVAESVDRLYDEHGVDTETTFSCEGERRHFHLNISRLDDSRASLPAGRLIVLRDITPLKRRERELERRESELEFLRQVLARVLRHNIRNDLTAVRGYAELIATETDGQQADLAETIVETSDDLIETSRKARLMERAIDRNATVETIDLVALLENLLVAYRSRYDRAMLSFEAPDECLVETDPWLENACDILLENALEHNDGQQPSVDVRVERTTDHATVTIDDDGPGIPRAELAVLEQGEETPLEHGSGIGLWIVYWIVDAADASVTFETDEGGTLVSLRVPMAFDRVK
ncbi:histidine kinase N-terminal 7TM domain-containing protein [Natrinema marinum]|uniref:histidine kinase N-terminal 7TM domain-containing protein n=1 Tax=Natrinema marinum TaxID=2961598 RepID=UPI0020C8DAB7|nr:histidine kinase N-terminal 7TM domain-containing protein [Natrinema marinum]